MSDPNPKLKVNLLKEVVCEIRFQPMQNLNLILGKFDNELKSDYPDFQDLNVPDFLDAFPDTANVIKYRFHNKDKTKLFQLGKGVLSVNATNYKDFESYLLDIKKVLSVFIKLSGVTSLTRIGLRYINFIEVPNKLEDVVNINFSLPDEVYSIQKGFDFLSVGVDGENKLHTRLRSKEETSSESVFLDFDYFTLQEKKCDEVQLLKWITTAHDKIYDTFVNSLNKDYYETLK